MFAYERSKVESVLNRFIQNYWLKFKGVEFCGINNCVKIVKMSNNTESNITTKANMKNGELQIVSSIDECEKIRCVKCNLPFWTTEQLKKHVKTHDRRKTLGCLHCQKKFARSDRLKMHIRSCKPTQKTSATKCSSELQIGLGAKGNFLLVESALHGVMQVMRYSFGENEQHEIYETLHSVVHNDVYNLVINTTGLFKWYLGLKVIFYKMIDPQVQSDPPAFFQTDPIASYYKYNDSVWEVINGQLEQQIENFERSGSGWVVSRLVSLDVTFAKIANPLGTSREDSNSIGA